MTTLKCDEPDKEDEEVLDKVFFDINGDLLSYDDVVDMMLNSKDEEKRRRVGRG